MSTTIEIAYYNTFILSGGESPGEWHVEESRIKGGFNETSVDFGVRAFLVNEKYKARRRPNAMIYSGVYNSKTNVNATNQFNISEDITKAVDTAHGSIQKLYAEDTNLIIFQENKVNKALIDKDAVFTAEGQPLTASSRLVIGQIVPFSGKFGISKNPESFAVYGGRKYFTDKKRGVVLRLSQDGLTPISDSGMRRFFADNLKKAQNLYGMYDEQKNKYILSMHGKGLYDTEITFCSGAQPGLESQVITDHYTVAYDETSKGWVSFYSYRPGFGFSLSNEFYTWPIFEAYETNNSTDNAFGRPDAHNWRFWKHHSDLSPRCNFYSAPRNDPSHVSFVFNDQPETIKNFSTIDYSGTDGWIMTQFITDMDRGLGIQQPISSGHSSNHVSYGDGRFLQAFNGSRFMKKEGKKVAALRSSLSSFFQYQHNLSVDQGPKYPSNSVRIVDSDSRNHATPSGVKGYYARVKFLTLNKSENNPLPAELSPTGLTIIPGTLKQELFSVNTGVKTSSESTYL